MQMCLFNTNITLLLVLMPITPTLFVKTNSTINNKDSFSDLCQEDQMTMMRLKFGHSKLSHNVFTKVRNGNFGMYPCDCGTFWKNKLSDLQGPKNSSLVRRHTFLADGTSPAGLCDPPRQTATVWSAETSTVTAEHFLRRLSDPPGPRRSSLAHRHK